MKILVDTTVLFVVEMREGGWTDDRDKRLSLVNPHTSYEMDLLSLGDETGMLRH